ncbi:forkhead box protein N3 isoform X1 [Alosa alosa]|uniref:forkhead box protein N3 isoform X1 n=1 Tax=Alosa alosa TaxID=278164 RepID=UPI002015478A|nr:forkhead box protein N3 isoform X1 [Alosa alosa]XP_048126780.1 forkhead box protein N3 isoform X1 [Alosa alosa]XP_048126781.1 forkhead box protein N3 isoform X1 [Alosa alosa]XP_048126782.1 forkhead box protein N3 isoform X1 [Alosa alosa]
MGPVMPPSKKSEGSGVSVASGLRRLYASSGCLSRALQEAEEMDLTLPLLPPGGLKAEKTSSGDGGGGGGGGGGEDEELTNLNWLHESKNLLNSFGDPVLRSVSPVQELDEDAPPSPAQSDLAYDAKQNANCKPPYSFSCLIFMAIEDAPAKRLPVKDIYNWILEHFPYFANAPTGWKNSVRHNLSLNKCFKKVDKDRSQSIGKGSLWCIDPEYRQNLIQALKKTPYHPYSQVFTPPPTSPQGYQSMSSPPVWPGSPFFRKNKGVLLQDPDIDAATAMMLLNASDLPFSFPQGVIQNGARMVSQSSFPDIRALPIRSVLAGCRMRSDSEPLCDSPLVSSDPKEDHNYSSGVKGDADSPSSGPLQGSEASFHSNEAASDTEDDDKSKIKKEPREWSVDACALAQHKKRQHLPSAKVRGQRLASDTLPLKKRRTEKPPESDDEEMKEAAGSLLHLAGVRACLNNITNRTAKGQKEASKN